VLKIYNGKIELSSFVGAEFIQKHIKDIIITEGKAFNLVFRYIGDALLINNPHFANCFPLIDKIKIRSTFLYQTL
jgi:hypothetical protein